MNAFDLSDDSWDSWFDKTCQLKETGETIVKGLPTNTLVPATGLPASIECNMQPSGGVQVQLGPGRFEISSHLIYLRGYFPTIKSSMTVVVEGAVHEILLPQSDGANCCTTLLTRTL